MKFFSDPQMIEQVLRAKFLGALTGTGVGDALGAPFEGYPYLRDEL